MLRFAITRGELVTVVGTEADRLVARCEELAAVGVEFLLLREKKLSAQELQKLAQRVQERTGGRALRVIVPGMDCGEAFGRHLPLAALPAERAMPSAGWVSVSCHTVDEVRIAHERQASAVLFAPVFGKTVDSVEVAPGVGLEKLREACLAAGATPVFALGGVTKANAAECVAAGAAGVAGIRMFFG